MTSMQSSGLMPRTRAGDGLGFAYLLSAIATVLLGVASLCGLLVGTRGIYDATPATLLAFYAQDAVTLVLALPLLCGAMWLAWRGALVGLLLWAGLLFYIVYMYFFYVVGARFNALFLVYVALESASLFALLGILLRIDPSRVRQCFAGVPVRLIGGFLVAIALLFASLWVTDVFRRLSVGAPLDPVSRLVFTADLTVVIPASAAAGVLLWRRRAWGYALAGLLLVKTTASGITLLVGTAFQLWWERPVDPAQTLGYVLVAGGGLLCTTLFFRCANGRVTLVDGKH